MQQAGVVQKYLILHIISIIYIDIVMACTIQIS